MNENTSAYVIQVCDRYTAQLRHAAQTGDIEAVIDIKARAEKLRVISLHEHLDLDANLAAAELMRRAERVIGLAVRRQSDGATTKLMPSGKTRMQALALVDGISDEDFETALAKARAAGNLSRVQVLKLLRTTVPALPKSKRRYIRQPLPAYAAESGWMLRKAVERVERSTADKRYPRNKAEVAEQLRGHLTHAIETLTKVLDRINQQGA